MTPFWRSPLAPYAMALITIFIWGATPLATQIAVASIDSSIVGMMRTVAAAALIAPVALLLRFPLPPDRAGWLALCVSALAGFVGYTLLFTVGLKHTSTTHAALILASAPVFTGLIGFGSMAFGQKPHGG
jgi:drug/metabolite transporter (DMT)-like permease